MPHFNQCFRVCPAISSAFVVLVIFGSTNVVFSKEIAAASASKPLLLVDVTASHLVGRNGEIRESQILDVASPENVASSSDQTSPRFDFLPQKGRVAQHVHLANPSQNTYDYYPPSDVDWVHYDFLTRTKVSSVQVYWLDNGKEIRTPASWRLLYRQGETWKEVGNTLYCTKRDTFNEVSFPPVEADGLILEIRMQQELSAGILRWKVNGATPRAFPAYNNESLVKRTRGFLKMRLGLAIALPALKEKAEENREVFEKYSGIAAALEKAAAKIAHLQKTAATDRLTSAAADVIVSLDVPYSRRDFEHFTRELDKICGREIAMRALIAADWVTQDTEREQVFTFDALARRISTGDSETAAETPAKRYLAACETRRLARLAPHLEKIQRVVYTRHHDIGGSHYAYTELLAHTRPHAGFSPRGALCLFEMTGDGLATGGVASEKIYGKQTVLVDAPRGIIRDPDVSYDGSRILFAKRNSLGDDYHLYEMNVANRQVRQLTNTGNVADYEGIYLPDGNILFNSTRCQQVVDCAGPIVSNFYLCDGDGKYIRRVGVDQVHTNYPQVLPDGRVVYTRWDYNDRGQIYTQPLFQMNPDGTGQTEFYGNNSWFPVSALHTRGIPGTSKAVTILSGHHAHQRGKLAILDPSRGRQEASGVQLIAPVRKTEAVTCDPYGHHGHQFAHPYALTEDTFLVSFSPIGSPGGMSRIQANHFFGVYLINSAGDRELLAADPSISSSQAIPLLARNKPVVRPSAVDYSKKTGTFVIQDIYAGRGLAGVKRGTVKSLRIVALEFRAASVGRNFNEGPAGGARIVTAISRSGAWDVKKVLGTAEVYRDGSAAFEVPALTPVYFQPLNKNGEAVQSMRSWSTLQPGETFACVGCHEDKNRAPLRSANTEAMRRGPQKLTPFYGKARGFSFVKEVQPILDKHCIRCHNEDNIAKHAEDPAKKKPPFTLEDKTVYERESRRNWSKSYLALADRKICQWLNPQAVPSLQAPYLTGAVRSPLIEMLRAGHNNVTLTAEELEKIVCWIDLAVPYCGDYTERFASSGDVHAYNRWQAVQDRSKKEDEAVRAKLAAEKGN